MKKRLVVSLSLAVLLAGLSACSGAYSPSIQGSYGSAYKRGSTALAAGDYERAVGEYAFAAKSDHPRALIAYGRLFAKGYGVERDPARAAELFEKAYGKRSDVRARAALELANVLLDGGDGPSGAISKDEDRARSLLLEALDGGEARAASRLGRVYDAGLGVDPDPDQAIAYYRRAPQNDAIAARRLAALLVGSGSSKEDVAEIANRAVSLLEIRADGGYQKAWLYLSDIFANGVIVDSDPPRAIDYLLNLHDDKDTAINIRLAKLYGQIGDGDQQRRQLQLAADAGNARAQTALAKLYLEPGTLDTNGAVGRYYALRAIGQNSTSAMLYLGLALVRGDVLDREPLAGESLLRRASESGHVGATAALGAFMLGGDIRSRQPGEGLSLLEEAAARGSSDAMRALGFAYHFGRGLPEDKTLASAWLERAADAGDQEAAEFLERHQEAQDAVTIADPTRST